VIRRRARLFDGTTSRHTDVELALYADGSLQLRGEGVHLDLHVNDVRVSPRLGATPRVLSLPGGGRCEVDDDDELARALRAGRGKASVWHRWIDRLERHRAAALVSVVITLATLAAVVQFGIPALASAVASSLPASAEARLGDGALAALDETWFAASELPPERRAALEARFDVLAAGVEPKPRLVMRAGSEIGANALALPGGLVVLTDELVALAERDDEIFAVLAHELGHVVHHHSMRAVLQNTGIGVLIAAALGDIVSISSFAGTLPTLLIQLQYSRRFEREADAYAVAHLARSGIPPDALASMLERLEQSHGGGAPVPAYLSTHPDTRERVREIRRGADAQEEGSSSS
jgi:predicted Zn-dependent protease